MTKFYNGELIDPFINNISLNHEVNDTEVKSQGKAKGYFWINTYSQEKKLLRH